MQIVSILSPSSCKAPARSQFVTHSLTALWAVWSSEHLKDAQRICARMQDPRNKEVGLLREKHGKQWPQQQSEEHYDGQELWEGLKNSSFSVIFMPSRLVIPPQTPIKMVQDSGSPSVIPSPEAAASRRNLLKTQILGAHHRYIKSEFLREELRSHTRWLKICPPKFLTFLPPKGRVKFPSLWIWARLNDSVLMKRMW